MPVRVLDGPDETAEDREQCDELLAVAAAIAERAAATFPNAADQISVLGTAWLHAAGAAYRTMPGGAWGELRALQLAQLDTMRACVVDGPAIPPSPTKEN